MIKLKFYSVIALFFTCSLNTITAQKTDAQVDAETNDKNIGQVVFKVKNPISTAGDTVNLTGTGPVSFIVSNKADGTTNTYRHSQKIVLPLVSTSRTIKYQLVFYGEYDNITYSVADEDGKLNIYYPAYMFQEIKQRLEQAFVQKKKVELRVIQKKDGYREGVIIF